MTFLYIVAIFVFFVVCMALTLVVLMQESKSTGLGASFGGGDVSDSLFGVSTPEILKKVTAYLATIFMVSCLILSYWTSAKSRIQTTPFVIEKTSEQRKK